jgi:hypothetical protein
VILPVILGATETFKPMSIDAPFANRQHAATGMSGAARPTTMMFITITTTRMRGGTG